MTGTKTNERPGTRAQVRYSRVSPYKAREVLDLIRNLPVDRADEVLQFTTRGPATVIRKVLASAIANAGHNDEISDAAVLYVSACYADEGPTLKRWRPRARGRATRIRKRTCHITVIVSVMPDAMLAKIEAERERAGAGAGRGAAAPRRGRTAKDVRRARVAKSRTADGHEGHDHDEHDHDHGDHEGHDHGDEAVEPTEAEAVEVEPTEVEAVDDTPDTEDEDKKDA